MRCPVCHTKMNKNMEICPNCGQRVEVKTRTSKVKRNRFTKKQLTDIIVCIVVFVSSIVWFSYRLWRMSRISQGEKNYTFEKALKESKGFLNEESVYAMINYRNDMKDILLKEGYEDITVSEDVIVENYRQKNISLIITASKSDYDIKISYSYSLYGNMIKSYAIAGSSVDMDRQFEIKEEDVKDIFEYMGFDNGYNALSDAYHHLEKTDNNKYQYINYSDYNITMSNEVYNKLYTYSYMISK